MMKKRHLAAVSIQKGVLMLNVECFICCVDVVVFSNNLVALYFRLYTFCWLERSEGYQDCSENLDV